jgi:hypothetical protein
MTQNDWLPKFEKCHGKDMTEWSLEDKVKYFGAIFNREYVLDVIHEAEDGNCDEETRHKKKDELIREFLEDFEDEYSYMF